MKLKFLIFNTLFLLATFNIAFAESLEISFANDFRYSHTPFFAGEDLRVYSTLQNSSGFDLQGIINFYDNDKFIGDFNFFIANGKFIESWTDWRPSEGEHNLSIKISSLKKLEIAKEPKAVILDKEISLSKKQVVDIDTDKDGIGNKEDLDDDNDNISDKKEIEQGTNPLVFDKAPIVKEKDIPKVKADSDKIISETKVAEGLFENVKNITEATLEKSKELSQETTIFLEKQKEAIDEKIEKDKIIELAQKELQDPSIEEEKKGVNLYTANIIDAVPNLKEIYSFILGVLIFIFNTWWVLLGVILLLLYLVWRMIRNKMELRRF